MTLMLPPRPTRYQSSRACQTSHLLQGPDRIIWDRRLVNGNQHGVIGTNTIEFINQFVSLATKKVTYGCFICDSLPLKSEQHRVRLVVGGDGLDYIEDAGTPGGFHVGDKIFTEQCYFGST